MANFRLIDLNGAPYELHRTEAKVVLLFFAGNGCPIVRQSAPKLREIRNQFGRKGLEVLVINSYPADDRAAIRREAREFGFATFRLFHDRDQRLATALNVQRTAEVIAISSSDWTLLYRGAIDDQLSEGAKKPHPDTRYLADALTQFFDNKPVTLAETKPRGCLIAFENVGDSSGRVSYSKEVAPILQNKCANCHSEGNIGPFPFNSHARARNKARMTEEVLLTGRMPPWHADPHYGIFENDRSLSAREMQTLLRWIQQGAEKDDHSDPLAEVRPAPGKWPLGQPDYILQLPAPELIPPTGVIEYRHVKIQNPIGRDAWLGAITINPGNLRVVHHVILRAKYRKGEDDGSGRGTMIAGWAPGYLPQRYPDHAGRFLPADAVFDLELHYNTIGSEQTDQTEIGLYLLQEKPRLEFRVQAAITTDFSIPPGEKDARTFAVYGFKKDAYLFSMSPHMHLRGSWFKYEALYPDGRRETLLSVPKYDFNWQTEYRLKDPLLIPRGTWLLCTGGFDNSKGNPNNPDPSQRVTWGDQSFEEMFIGFFDIADVPKGEAVASKHQP